MSFAANPIEILSNQGAVLSNLIGVLFSLI